MKLRQVAPLFTYYSLALAQSNDADYEEFDTNDLVFDDGFRSAEGLGADPASDDVHEVGIQVIERHAIMHCSHHGLLHLSGWP